MCVFPCCLCLQDYNDEIRQAQLQELTYLNGGSEDAKVPAVRGKPVARGRGTPAPGPLRYPAAKERVRVSVSVSVCVPSTFNDGVCVYVCVCVHVGVCRYACGWWDGLLPRGECVYYLPFGLTLK